MKPFFSIVLPTYNRRHQLERCIDSIKAQDYLSFEIIVVDDGSTDETRKFIQDNHPDVRYYHQTNQGVSKARNTGIEKAQGPYIAFIDSDDMWYPSRLSILYAAAVKMPPDVGLIFNDMDRIINGRGDGTSYADRYFEVKGRRVLDSMHQAVGIDLPQRNLNASYGHVFPQLLHGNIISPPCTVMKKEVLNTLGNFREDFRVANDSELFLRASKAYKVGYVPMILTSIAPPREKTSLSTSANSIEKIKNMIMVIESYYHMEEKEILKQQLKLRLATLHGRLGYHYLIDYRVKKSRNQYKRALQLDPLNLKSFLILYLTWLPVGLLRFAARAKRELRKLIHEF